MHDRKIELLWGAGAIGAALGVNERRALRLLEAGEIQGARKMRGRWVIARCQLNALFLEEEAA